MLYQLWLSKKLVTFILPSFKNSLIYQKSVLWSSRKIHCTIAWSSCEINKFLLLQVMKVFGSWINEQYSFPSFYPFSHEKKEFESVDFWIFFFLKKKEIFYVHNGEYLFSFKLYDWNMFHEFFFNRRNFLYLIFALLYFSKKFRKWNNNNT